MTIRYCNFFNFKGTISKVPRDRRISKVSLKENEYIENSY